MRLLLTNDDGIACDGIHVLAKALVAKGHDVRIVAPHKNRSGVSHGINMTKPLLVHKVDDSGNNGANKIITYTCEGLPVDCVVLGLRGLFEDWVAEAVISGINCGANLGTDVVYSGTASAARQACFMGLPALAVSLDTNVKQNNYEILAQFVADNLPSLLSLCEDGIFVNINAPAVKKFAGYRYTSLSKRRYCDKIQLYNSPQGEQYSFFVGGDVKSICVDDADVTAVNEGFVSITRLCAEPTSANYSKFLHLSFSV